VVLILPVPLNLLIVFASIPISFVLLVQTGKLRWLWLAPITAFVLFFPIVFERAYLLANGLVWRQEFNGQWVGLTRSGAATTGLQHQPPFRANLDYAEVPINVAFLVSGPAEWPQNTWEHCPGRTTTFGLTEIVPTSEHGCFRAAGGDEKFYRDADSLVRCVWTKQGLAWDKQTEIRVCTGNFVESRIDVTVFFAEAYLAHWRNIEKKIRPIVRQAFVLGGHPEGI
jgi:hypothetical protein